MWTFYFLLDVYFSCGVDIYQCLIQLNSFSQINCAVIPREGSKIDEADVAGFCKKNLAAFKVPKKVFMTDSLPKTATGKIQRRLVADRSQLQKCPSLELKNILGSLQLLKQINGISNNSNTHSFCWQRLDTRNQELDLKNTQNHNQTLVPLEFSCGTTKFVYLLKRLSFSFQVTKKTSILGALCFNSRLLFLVKLLKVLFSVEVAIKHRYFYNELVLVFLLDCAISLHFSLYILFFGMPSNDTTYRDSRLQFLRIIGFVVLSVILCCLLKQQYHDI